MVDDEIEGCDGAKSDDDDDDDGEDDVQDDGDAVGCQVDYCASRKRKWTEEFQLKLLSSFDEAHLL